MAIRTCAFSAAARLTRIVVANISFVASFILRVEALNLECADNGGALDFVRLRIQSGVALRLPPHSKNWHAHFRSSVSYKDCAGQSLPRWFAAVIASTRILSLAGSVKVFAPAGTSIA